MARPTRRATATPDHAAPCNPALLAPYNSYGVPPFVARGFYLDTAFQCAACQKQDIWRATQQKWWYEVAQGSIYSKAVRCRACRLARRALRDSEFSSNARP